MLTPNRFDRRGGPRALVGRSLDTRRFQEADIEYGVYVAPLGNRGLHVVKSECNDTPRVVGGPKRTFAPNSIVPLGSHTNTGSKFILADPPPGRGGGSVFELDFPVPAVFDALRIDSADPSTIPNGTTVVTLTGLGFLESPVDTFEAGYNVGRTFTPDPYAVVDSVAWVSETEVDVTITVTGAPDGYGISIQVSRS